MAFTLPEDNPSRTRSTDFERSAPRRPALRLAAAGGVVVGTLLVAAPAWAGPILGC